MLNENNNGFGFEENDENEKIVSSFDNIEENTEENTEKNCDSPENTETEENVCTIESCVDKQCLCDAEEEADANISDEECVSYTEGTKNGDFAGGVYYTKNVDGNISEGYEWNHDANKKADSTKKEEKKTNKGFRIFLGATLSVFTLSLVALTVMIASYINDAKAKSDFSDKSVTSENFDYNSVSIENPNYVAFDFKEHEGKVLSIPEIAAKCSPSSVGIISRIETTSSIQSIFPFYFDTPSTRIAQASGSGFVYSADGYIITNHHVIDGATKITVILPDNSEYEAELIGSDSISDIAVLKITPNEGTTLIPMELGNSDELVVGEPVVAIGCPAGVEFIGTVTDGIISSINRNIEIKDDYGNTQKNMTLIQTNATINHGNSGGPLINSKGQVIGINTLKLSANYEGIGFSIPINGATPIIKQLIEHGQVVERTEDDFAYGQGIIGINGTAISKDESEYYGIPEGVLVVQLNKGSSAANAGLRRGDIITHYDGKEVKSINDINSAKGNARAGTSVTLTVYRDSDDGNGETLDITFNLDAKE